MSGRVSTPDLKALAAKGKDGPEPGSLQWVWSLWNWREWRVTFFRLPPKIGLSCIYEWCLYLGPLQVRRFVTDPPAALARMRAARSQDQHSVEAK